MREAGLAHDALDRGIEQAVGTDHRLQAAGEQVPLPVPVAQVLLGDPGQVLVIAFRLVPHQRLLDRDVEVVTAGDTTMGTDQAGDHVAVAVGIQDSLDHHVVAGVERVAGDRVDQADVGTAGHVPFAQHDPPQVVLPDQGQAPPEAVPDPGRHRRLAGRRVPAHHYQPGLFSVM